MNYITYFDLLGTRGFCDDSDLYYHNLKCFNVAVEQTGALLLKHGKVGIFSDSAYAESDELQLLLQFLTLLRNRLFASGLYFNAVVKKGKLGVEDISEHHSNVFGVTFLNKEIASLYIAQTAFKGIGIYIDESITDSDMQDANCPFVDCVYMKRITNGSNDEYIPTRYRDISLKAFDSLAERNKKFWESILETFLQEFYKGFAKAPKYGAYYISLFCNFIRSFGNDLAWDMHQKKFSVAPLIFEVATKMLTTTYDSLRNLPGIACLALFMLDTVYGSDTLSDFEKDSVTSMIIKYKCIEETYLHNLDRVPHGVFQSAQGQNHRDRFIRYCQSNSATDFVNSVFRN